MFGFVAELIDPSQAAHLRRRAGELLRLRDDRRGHHHGQRPAAPARRDGDPPGADDRHARGAAGHADARRPPCRSARSRSTSLFIPVRMAPAAGRRRHHARARLRRRAASCRASCCSPAFVPFVWGLGLVTAAAIVTFRRGTGLLGVIMSVLGLASGAFFPLALLPAWLQTLAEANPVAIAMEGTREALIGGAGWSAIGSRRARARRPVGRRAVRRRDGLPRRAGARAPPRDAGALLMWERDRQPAGARSTSPLAAAPATASSCSRRAAGAPPGSPLGARPGRRRDARRRQRAGRAGAARARARGVGRPAACSIKGPEVALDYGAPGLRRFGDLDLLTDDAQAAQAALLAAGFQEVVEPEIYDDIHHLRPLWWPGLPLVIELHTRAELAGAACPARRPRSCSRPPCPRRLGVRGRLDAPARAPRAPARRPRVGAPAARPAREPDRRRRDAAPRRRAPRSTRWRARWGCARLWRTTDAAVRAVRRGRAAARPRVALWARHLRERARAHGASSAHLQDLLAPRVGPAAAPRAGAVAPSAGRRPRPDGPRALAAQAQPRAARARATRASPGRSTTSCWSAGDRTEEAG